MQPNPIELLNLDYEDLDPEQQKLAVLAGLESDQPQKVNEAAQWLKRGIPVDEVVVLALGRAIRSGHLQDSIAAENEKRLEHWQGIFFGEVPLFRSVMSRLFLNYFTKYDWELDEGPVRENVPEAFNQVYYAGQEARIANPMQRVLAVIDEGTLAEMQAPQYIKWLSRKLKKKFSSKEPYACVINVVCFSGEPPRYQAIERFTKQSKKWYQFEKHNPFQIVIWDFNNEGFNGKTARHFSPKTRTAINNRIQHISLNLKNCLAWTADVNQPSEQMEACQKELNYIQHVVVYMIGFNKRL